MIEPGGTIGILGGGQLGRMLAVAASRLGLRVHIFEPGAEPPAGDVAHRVTTASYDDAAALGAFAASVDVVTYEFENIPAQALDLIEAAVPVRPGRRALAVSQDRLDEKQFLEGLGLHVAPYADIPDEAALKTALARIGTPAILKTRRFGYDGKGQVRITEGSTDALAALNGAPAILEGMVRFEREISVIAARAVDGWVRAFDPGENVHRNGILHTTSVPATLSLTRAAEAVEIATKVLNALDYVGVIGVELFDIGDAFIVNEFAPRVHNSGHWTQNGAHTCQFEQHIRAVAGWPLGPVARHSDILMLNLIGDEVRDWASFAAEDGTAVHLYGKREVRAGRKMGHVNRW